MMKENKTDSFSVNKKFIVSWQKECWLIWNDVSIEKDPQINLILKSGHKEIFFLNADPQNEIKGTGKF